MPTGSQIQYRTRYQVANRAMGQGLARAMRPHIVAELIWPARRGRDGRRGGHGHHGFMYKNG